MNQYIHVCKRIGACLTCLDENLIMLSEGEKGPMIKSNEKQQICFNCDDVIRLRPALRGLSHGSVWETRQNLLSLRLLNILQREKSCMDTRTLCLSRRL